MQQKLPPAVPKTALVTNKVRPNVRTRGFYCLNFGGDFAPFQVLLSAVELQL